MFEEIKNPESGKKYIYPMRTYLLTSKNVDSNIITLDWVMPISIDPPLLAVAIGEQRHTHEILKNSDDFVVSVPTKDLLDDVWYSGTKSGADVNKFEETNLTKKESINVDSPSIKECISNIECDIIDSDQYGDHFLYVGEIVGGTYKKEYFEGVLSKKEVDPGLLMHLSGEKFVEENLKNTIKSK